MHKIEIKRVLLNRGSARVGALRSSPEFEEKFRDCRQF